MRSLTHILIIEDDSGVARSLKQGFEREGYSITWRESGAAGVDWARNHHPQLIILDVRLPDSSGYDVCKQLRALGLRQPILMLTAKREEIDKVIGLESGADDYITKPYGLHELLARVRALFRRAYGELALVESDVLYAGDLVIDRARGQVLRGHRQINLTPIEFRLLTYLAQHAGQVLTREQILESVWGHNAEVEDEKVVNVNIRRLREKVELDSSQPALILTVPGLGYRLVHTPIITGL
jgi:DNA-binding response OmpR family regulator